MKEVELVIVVDDLDFKIKDVAFEAKVLNRYGTFDQIANRSMERSKLCIFALELVGQGNFDHNHFESEIVSYRATETTFVERHVCEGGKFWH